MPSSLQPDFVLFNSVRSKSFFLAVSAIYASTSSLFSTLSIRLLTISPSGANTINVIPYIVSIHVVKIENFPPSTISNSTSTPVLLPIQFLCISFVDSGQSISSKPSKSFSANAGWSITHCFIFFLTTG